MFTPFELHMRTKNTGACITELTSNPDAFALVLWYPSFCLLLAAVLNVNTLQGKNQCLHFFHSTLQYWPSVAMSIRVPKISHKLPDVLGKKMGLLVLRCHLRDPSQSILGYSIYLPSKGEGLSRSFFRLESVAPEKLEYFDPEVSTAKPVFFHLTVHIC